MSQLSDQHRSFIDHYVEYGNASQAYEAAGYVKDSANAHRLLVKLSDHINQAHRSRMASFAGVALAELERMISDSETHNRDKINAINSYLDRCGISRASTVQLNQTTQTEKKKVKRIAENGGVQIDYSTNPDCSMWLPALDGQTEEDIEWDLGDPETAHAVSNMDNRKGEA